VFTHVFDIGAGVDGNHVTVLYPKVVTDDTVDSSAAIIELLIGENDQDSVFSLLSSNENSVATEKL
jgi:hypothetical protein